MSADIWQVQIQGQPSDLEHLARHFASPTKRVLKDEYDGGFLYESDSFAACRQSEEVLNLANDELCVLSGILEFTRDSPEPLRTGAVYRRNASGGRDTFIHVPAPANARAEFGEVTVTVTDSEGNLVSQPTPPSRIMLIDQLVAADASVEKAMRLYGSPDHNSWTGMYRIYEVIEADIGGELALIKRGWCSSKDLKRFKHSANSVTVAGGAARHGKEVKLPPKAPMSSDEAAAYLKRLLNSWLSSKGA